MSEISKCEYRAVIKFLTLEKRSANNIYERLTNVYGDSAPSYATVTRWVAEFKRGRTSLEDDPRAGRPVEATTDDCCHAVEMLVMGDRRLKVLEIAREVGISYGSVLNILHDHLGLSKVCARWVPRLLTPVQKSFRVETCSELLGIYSANSDNVLSRIVTGDETWIHHWDPDTKQESMQWKHANSPPPRKFHTQPSAGKVMATIFWDCKGVLLVDYLPHKTTMTGSYYGELLRNLRQAVKEKRRGMLTRGPLLLHDNAPAHMSRVAQAVVKDIGFEQLSHPPYSPDLAPSDFYLFRHLKKHLRGTRFGDDDELKQATESYLDSMPQEFYLTGIRELFDRCRKCVDVTGDYIEK